MIEACVGQLLKTHCDTGALPRLRIDETMSSSSSGAEVAGDPGPIGHVFDLAMLHHHFHHSAMLRAESDLP